MIHPLITTLLLFFSIPCFSKDEDLSSSEKYPFVQPWFKNYLVDVSKFNYEGKCREPFKYKPNNKRDLVFLGLHYSTNNNNWSRQRQITEIALNLMNSSIPHATKILYVYNDLTYNLVSEVFQQFGFEVKRSDLVLRNDENYNVAAYRFIEFKKFLEKHKNEYDRAVISDVRDVYWFADGFQTISYDEIFVQHECDEMKNAQNEIQPRCLRFATRKADEWNRKWIKTCFGEEVAKEIDRIAGYVVNSGFIAGSMNKMVRFIDIYTSIFEPKIENMHIWGFDQAALNYGFHTGKFEEIGLVAEKTSQRIGFDMMGNYNYDRKEKVLTMKSSGCSPIIRHKIGGNGLVFD